MGPRSLGGRDPAPTLQTSGRTRLLGTLLPSLGPRSRARDDLRPGPSPPPQLAAASLTPSQAPPARGLSRAQLSPAPAQCLAYAPPSRGPFPHLHFSVWPRARGTESTWSDLPPLQAHEGAGVRWPSATAPPAGRWQDSRPRRRNAVEGWVPTGATPVPGSPSPDSRHGLGRELATARRFTTRSQERPGGDPVCAQFRSGELRPPSRKPGLRLPEAGSQGHWAKRPGAHSGLAAVLPTLAGDRYLGENSAGHSLKIYSVACN